MTRVISLAFAALIAVAAPVLAQDLAFGTSRPDPDEPVAVEADALAVNQEDGTATFTGNVVITQGDMVLSAETVLVVYKEDSQKIASLDATGGVTMVSGEDAAEAQNAQYDIDAGTVLLTGQVLLSQGDNVMSGDRITIDLNAGTAQAGGRVRTTLQTGN
ncbi:Lipopolysaccharide export system protein LptA precursor [Thalassovita autumnalis]|uniref:Lipopolysaccharide export system protein LptA n=1 Tax=Thalassovita autumnalis TaxID=2072972 RepID=A0A0P1FY44_9RHOB|nr:lipopolysaccharide transport periplasmic protein LptA [Thalassovita autumnalis]CUH66465.1 Lipopolysaccharide export system protein LptA precursor [Thalassovita autumnalis]CUH71218.1 Lipopolysaccharide export system protein LptA precursor [Thalassovita autumnalis]